MRRTPLKRKSRLKKKATDSVSKLKQQLWQLCREIAKKKYEPTCYTCGAKNLSGSNLQLGHFISSSICSAAMRYDLDNLRFQCAACNIWKSGNWVAFEEHLRRDGIDTEELKRRNRATIGRKYDSLYYLARIKEYEAILAALPPSKFSPPPTSKNG